MGGGSFTSSDWSSFSAKKIAGKSREEVFEHKLVDEMNPLNFTMRESCDSAEHPNSTPLIVALDVTGSMGSIAEVMARQGLKTLAEEIYARKPISDPQMLFMGIGDVECDNAPVQCSQFESDIRIAEQLTKLYLEGGGGGNDHESYSAAWYFGAFRTKIDSFLKHGRKGYLFTIGDEYPTKALSREHLKEFFGDDIQSSMYTDEQLFNAVSKYYNVYHIIVAEGNCARRELSEVTRAWRELLGQRVIVLDDHTKIAEVIVSVIQVAEGENTKKVTDSWDGSTGVVVAKAIRDMSTIPATVDKHGVVKL